WATAPGSPTPERPAPEHLVPEMRYRLLETMREYGAGQLSPEERADLGRQHAQFFLALAEEPDPERPGAAQPGWLGRLGRAHESPRTCAPRWRGPRSGGSWRRGSGWPARCGSSGRRAAIWPRGGSGWGGCWRWRRRPEARRSRQDSVSPKRVWSLSGAGISTR